MWIRDSFGECPVIWIQNVPSDEEMDGDPDCYGIFHILQSIDTLLSQATRGTIGNCDPTIGVESDADFEQIKTGTGNALQVEKGARIHYMEMSGTGIEKAMQLADQLEQKALTVARCMLDRNQGGPSRTVSEVEHNYSSMIEQADVYREQYGERGIKRLLEMVLRIARTMDTGQLEEQEDGSKKAVKTVITLPRRRNVDPQTKKVTYSDRKLGDAEQIRLKWPDYFTPSLETVAQAVAAAAQAWGAGILDLQNVVEFIASYMGVEDVETVLARLEEAKEKNAEMFGDAANDMLNSITKSKTGKPALAAVPGSGQQTGSANPLRKAE